MRLNKIPRRRIDWDFVGLVIGATVFVSIWWTGFATIALWIWGAVTG